MWRYESLRSLSESPNQALQRTAIGIKCSAAGGRAESAPERWRARVLEGRRAVAELGSWATPEGLAKIFAPEGHD